mmetsp:Transcript_72682/g.115065  ORF Transcript_72682/g.115065 Transcript_72682/m.115065 type:complete len:202 (-) Transcript_72682:100-705(-)
MLVSEEERSYAASANLGDQLALGRLGKQVSHIDQRALLFGCRFGKSPDALLRGREIAEAREEASRLAAVERELIQERNDELVDDLQDKVSELRIVAENISQEVSTSSRILEGMTNKFDNARDLLQKSHERLQNFAKEPASRNIFRMTLFCVLLVLIVYFLSPQIRSIMTGARAMGSSRVGAGRFLDPTAVADTSSTRQVPP